MRQTPGRMEVWHERHRYWGSLKRKPGPCGVSVWYWQFWSDHDWPFYHGSYTQATLDRKDAMSQFLKWLPFDTESY